MPQAAPAPAPSASAGWQDPYRNYNFKLEIQGVVNGHFAECRDIRVSIKTIEYREAGLQQVVHKLPGPVDYADVVLRYGLTSSSGELWNWFIAAANGNVERKNVSIVLLDSTGANEVVRWNLNRAWPREWNGAVLNTRGNDAAIETLILACETIQRG